MADPTVITTSVTATPVITNTANDTPATTESAVTDTSDPTPSSMDVRTKKNSFYLSQILEPENDEIPR